MPEVKGLLKMLRLMVLSLHFTISHGFRFDNYTGPVTVEVPITVSWHRDVNDVALKGFMQNQLQVNDGFDVPLSSSTNTTQPDGTVNVTFHSTGLWAVFAQDQNFNTIASSQTFNVASGGSKSSTVPSSSLPAIPSTSMNSSSSSMAGTRQQPSSSTESAQSTASASPSSNSIHQNHKTPIIIGAVTGSLAFLLLIFGGGTFLFICKWRHRNSKHSPSPNPKIIPEKNSHSPPVGNKSHQTISPMLAGEMTPNEGDRSQDTVKQNPEGDRIEDKGERRNSIRNPVHVDTSECQSPREESPPAPLDDVGAEVLILRDQVQGNVFDPPPAYA